MGIVRFALRLPQTFYVMVIAILFPGVSSAITDQRVTAYSQYSISSNVNDIRNMQAQTLSGISVLKLARAVIGGVLAGPVTTLLFVPYLYSIMGRFETRKPANGELA